MTAVTAAQLDNLTGEDRRTLALRILAGAVSALDANTKDHDLTNHLDPAPVHAAADWIHEILINPDDGYNHDTWGRHSAAVRAFRDAAVDIGQANTGNGYAFPPRLNAATVDLLLDSVYYRGTPHRLAPVELHFALIGCVVGFVPSHNTPAGFALKALCDSDDPRLPALAETYIQSGLQVNLRPAINRATRQLAHLDELTELTR